MMLVFPRTVLGFCPLPSTIGKALIQQKDSGKWSIMGVTAGTHLINGFCVRARLVLRRAEGCRKGQQNRGLLERVRTENGLAPSGAAENNPARPRALRAAGGVPGQRPQ